MRDAGRTLMERTTVHATLLKTSEIMKHSALGRNTVRFYEDKGLIKPSHRTSAGYRMYSGETLHDLEFIKHAKAAGLSLDQIKDLLTLGRADSTTCGVVAKKIEARIAD